MKKLLAAITVLCLLVLPMTSCISTAGFSLEQFEQILSGPYTLKGTLTKDLTKYDVSIKSNRAEDTFRIEFLSGEATKGLTIEFFTTGTFLYFDDLRFKTNNEFFTSLSLLKEYLFQIASPDVKKTIEKSNINDSMEIYEIILPGESGDCLATLYVNPQTLKPIRLVVNSPDKSVTLDVTSFEEIIYPTGTTTTVMDESSNPTQ